MTVLGESQDAARRWKRRLILRDSLVFVGLVSLTVVLFLVTLFLFRSFSAHRVELAHRWYGRGQRAMASGDAKQAVVDLRIALGYAPTERSYQLLMAEALSEAGSPNEALAYFSNLWESQPGSGALNLQMARLTARNGKSSDAIHYYRAAIYGTWEGDGSLRRREVRLELIRYLLSGKEFATARTELLIAAGNASDDPDTLLEIAGLMAKAGELPMALTEYERVLARSPRDVEALVGAGRSAFQMQRYTSAQRFLAAALRRSGGNGVDSSAKDMLVQAQHLLALYPGQELSLAERTRRTLVLLHLAKGRWDQCAAKLPQYSARESEVEDLGLRWMSEQQMRPAQLRDPEMQRAELSLAFDTEQTANRFCGAPEGDDALVLLMAQSPGTVEQ